MWWWCTPHRWAHELPNEALQACQAFLCTAQNTMADRQHKHSWRFSGLLIGTRRFLFSKMVADGWANAFSVFGLPLKSWVPHSLLELWSLNFRTNQKGHCVFIRVFSPFIFFFLKWQNLGVPLHCAFCLPHLFCGYSVPSFLLLLILLNTY